MDAAFVRLISSGYGTIGINEYFSRMLDSEKNSDESLCRRPGTSFQVEVKTAAIRCCVMNYASLFLKVPSTSLDGITIHLACAPNRPGNPKLHPIDQENKP
jgi:hypothetical protein